MWRWHRFGRLRLEPGVVDRDGIPRNDRGTADHDSDDRYDDDPRADHDRGTDIHGHDGHRVRTADWSFPRIDASTT